MLCNHSDLSGKNVGVCPWHGWKSKAGLPNMLEEELIPTRLGELELCNCDLHEDWREQTYVAFWACLSLCQLKWTTDLNILKTRGLCLAGAACMIQYFQGSPPKILVSYCDLAGLTVCHEIQCITSVMLWNVSSFRGSAWHILLWEVLSPSLWLEVQQLWFCLWFRNFSFNTILNYILALILFVSYV